MKYITVDNYKEFKPSEFVESFISDIEVAEKIGKPMDMDNWVGNGCLPCLGGMACMNMGISPFGNQVGDIVSNLGDHIRSGYADSVQDFIEDLFNIKLPSLIFKRQRKIEGEIKTAKQFNNLKKQVAYYADTLKKAGL